MTSYHFDLGNSSEGPIGYCARVKAETPEEALEILRELLPQVNEIHLRDERIEYLSVYFNKDAITVKDIDDEEDCEDDDDPVVDDFDRSYGPHAEHFRFRKGE